MQSLVDGQRERRSGLWAVVDHDSVSETDDTSEQNDRETNDNTSGADGRDTWYKGP